MTVIQFKPKEDLEGILNTTRYELQRELGRGAWGIVYEAYDNATGGIVAIKVLNLTPLAERQLEHRKLTPFSAIAKEDLLVACAHVVPRRFEVDEKGRPFVVMPKYNSFLSDVFSDGSDYKRSVGNGRISEEQGLRYARDIANGIRELQRAKRAHGDLKPDNIAISEEGELLLNDLGTSTCVAFDWAQRSPRDNMGFLFTRAPENFDERNHPGTKSDVYSLGCLLYRLFSRNAEYPFEEEIRRFENPEELFRMSREEYTRMLRNRIRDNIPWVYRRLIRKCLDIYSYERPSIEKVIEDIERMQFNRTIPGKLTRFGKTFSWIVVPTAILTYGSYEATTYEPQELEVPKTQIEDVKGILARPGTESLGEFVSEGTEGLSEVPPYPTGMLFDGMGRYAKQYTKNRDVAYLAKNLRLAVEMDRRPDPITEFQLRLFHSNYEATEANYILGYSGPFWPVVILSIESAMIESAKQNNGKMDLEDVMVMARFGPEKLTAAKNAARSNDYSQYKMAVDFSTGERIIPEDETRLIDTWLTYYFLDY
jgi:serine/threonine protein kinase